MWMRWELAAFRKLFLPLGALCEIWGRRFFSENSVTWVNVHLGCHHFVTRPSFLLLGQVWPVSSPCFKAAASIGVRKVAHYSPVSSHIQGFARQPRKRCGFHQSKKIKGASTSEAEWWNYQKVFLFQKSEGLAYKAGMFVREGMEPENMPGSLLLRVICGNKASVSIGFSRYSYTVVLWRL